VSRVSLFRVTSHRDLTQLFNIVALLLSAPGDGNSPSKGAAHHFWGQFSFLTGDMTCFVCMWLVREDDGTPKHFQMLFLASDGADDDQGEIRDIPVDTATHMSPFGSAHREAPQRVRIQLMK
jgi:hypothetical protein